jgi:response regulator NasT
LVKPFQREELVSAIEVALGRFEEILQLDATVRELEEKLEARKAVDRAKGVLMDGHGLSEADAFAFVQKTAMSERSSMFDIANRIISGDLIP